MEHVCYEVHRSQEKWKFRLLGLDGDGFYFTSMTREERWLRFQYNFPDVHLFMATQIATLNEVTYSTVLFVKCDFTDLQLKDNGRTEHRQAVRTGRQIAFS